jgi:hypothetical protein
MKFSAVDRVVLAAQPEIESGVARKVVSVVEGVTDSSILSSGAVLPSATLTRLFESMGISDSSSSPPIVLFVLVVVEAAVAGGVGR